MLHNRMMKIDILMNHNHHHRHQKHFHLDYEYQKMWTENLLLFQL
jgi:hypothetical protein